MRHPYMLLAAGLCMLLCYSCDKNETVPQIADQVFTIAENTPVGTQVGIIEAEDPDEGQVISFEITEGNEDEAFQLSQYDGILSVLSSSALDYETKSEHLITVSVNDNHDKDPLESSATIQIILEDVNEVTPDITAQVFSMDENPNTGQAIGTLLVEHDEGQQKLSFTIVDEPYNTAMRIDEEGTLFVVDSSMFDYESQETILFKVKVCDDHSNPLCDSAFITINLNNITEFEDGLIAYYTFNGDAQDVSGNEHHGTVLGPELTTDRKDQENGAYYFDGVDDHILLPQDEVFHFEARELTISCWFRLESGEPTGTARTLFSVYNASGGRECFVESQANNDSMVFVQYNMGDITTRDLVYGPSEAGWHMVTFTRDSNNLSYYYDGNLIVQTPATATMIYSSALPMIGAKHMVNTSPDQFFEGKIDELSIHSRALDAEEVLKLYWK